MIGGLILDESLLINQALACIYPYLSASNCTNNEFFSHVSLQFHRFIIILNPIGTYNPSFLENAASLFDRNLNPAKVADASSFSPNNICFSSSERFSSQ